VLAQESLAFNLQDKTFCELFPNEAEVCRQKLAEFAVTGNKAAKPCHSDKETGSDAK
jgi:hypothetical protein